MNLLIFRFYYRSPLCVLLLGPNIFLSDINLFTYVLEQSNKHYAIFV